ncbi:MAG: Gfo/Idh/MocA family oxidoreductase [Desulfobacterales bacterium]|nr:Gfo/Idh/MocA family oxidoreductase [Deltaproteobacteria bacterium]NNK95866.1 Gfo/Idh/MocA family oxidoreductase [Desulfobacterales bacterium]
MRVVRVGIVGSGFAARFHLEALQKVYGVQVELTGVYSPTEQNCHKFAQENNIKAFHDLVSLVDESDVVHVCTPPSTHEEIGIVVLRQDKYVVIEKPFTGYFGSGKNFSGDSFDRQTGLEGAAQSVRNLLNAEAKSDGCICYAENWVYAPGIQKEKEIIEKTGAQIIWMHGEESHSGSHSPYYGIWSHSGGGSIMGKAVHPLGAALYLKQIEGMVSQGRPIRPATVTARVHFVTRSEQFRDVGFIKTGYTDIEDFGSMHIVFEDGMFADIFASELVLGGVHNWIEITANNHRTVVNINPNNSMQSFNPKASQFNDIYVVEKIETKEGWSSISPDEDWYTGYQSEVQDFCQCAASNTIPQSNSTLAADTILTIYASYCSAAANGKEIKIPTSV